MASSFSPITQANPGSALAVDASNPFYATFWANEAALNFSAEKALAEDQRATRETNASYEYNKGVDNRAEPLKLTANQNSANSAGLAESGMLAKTQGTTQTDYAQKNERLAETRRNAVEKYQEAERGTVTQYGLDTAKNVADAQAEALKAQEENPPQPDQVAGNAPANPAVASNPGGVKTVTGPAGPGGVVPYTETSSRGMVRVGPATPTPKPAAKPAVSAIRKAAAKKAVAVG
jgi:hypothetical protein